MNFDLLDRERKEKILKSALSVRGRSLWSDARRRLFKNKAAVTGLIILSIILLFSLFGPLFLQYKFDQTNWDAI